MTAINQDFAIYAGDNAAPIFTVLDGDGVAINIATVDEISWSVRRDLGSSPVLTLTKTGGAITLPGGGTDGKFQVAISASNSSPLSGYYLHTATITDSSGNVSTVTLGRLQVGQAPVWTYSGDPANSDRDAVRSYIGDTDPSDKQMTDPEIDYILTKFTNPILAAAQCARRLGAKYARKVNKRVGDLSISYSDIAKQYFALADELQAQGNTFNLAPYSGGISHADKRAVRDNTDRVRPPFREKQFDNKFGPNETAYDDGFGDGS